jgi:trehalose/maltose hydrolase-like predicted phosphorylase
LGNAESIGEWAARQLAVSPQFGWALQESGYDPLLEREVESRFSVGNGLIGVRGSLEIPTMASRPRTYVAGLFDLVLGASTGPSLAPAPDWLRILVTIDGAELLADEGGVALSRTLDLESGILRTGWEQTLPSGQRVSLRALRLASLLDRSLALQIVQLIADSRAQLALEALIVPTGLTLILDRVEGPISLWRTASSGRGLAIASHAELYAGGSLLTPDAGNGLARRWRWTNVPGEPATLIRTITFSPHPDLDGRDRRLGSLVAWTPPTAPDVLTSHTSNWHERWKASDISLEGDEDAQSALRFAVYQLTSAADPENERVSIGARGLTGDAYAGHVFWDTEIFLLPFYTFTWPEAARALLMYRYHTLPAARAKALRLGYEGALYAWESADTGEETTPESVRMPSGEIVPILCGLKEHHISADIAYAVWQYWNATQHVDFLLQAGAEILLETARFWASRATMEADGRYHIRSVIGPDEYHEGVDDNAYTNGMAQWNLETGLAVVRLIESRWPERWEELARQLRLTDAELVRWDDVAVRIHTGLHQESNLLEQFAGFFRLETVDLAAYEPRSTAMDMILGRDRTHRSQVIKQADVVMLLALLWDRFTPAARAANFRYYERICGHGSSLSPAIHSLVAARLGELQLADGYFLEATSIDLGDTMGNLSGGLHMAALGGLWQAVVFGFAGMSVAGDGLAFYPRLTRRWRSLSFPILWRGSRARIKIQREEPQFSAAIEHGDPVTITVGGRTQTLRQGQGQSWDLTTATPVKELSG